jgi:hypothetical protein
MVYCFDITEITDEKKATSMADELLLEAIEVSTISRGKLTAIKVCESKTKQLQHLCKLRKWKTAMTTLMKGRKMLASAEAHLDSIWDIR